MRKTSVLISIIFLILCSCSQEKKETEFAQTNELSQKTQDIVSDLIEYGEITGSAVGYSGGKPKQWDNFTDLKKNATDQELLLLTEHPNPVVKCYAFDLLVKKRNKSSFNILKKNLKDTTSVSTQYGCIGSMTRVNDYFIESISRPYPDNEYLTKSDKKTLDSLILFTPDLISDNKNRLLERIEPNEKYYDRIRELALKENNSAIIAISKYHRESDIDFINQLLEDTNKNIQRNGLKAVKNFPNEDSFKRIIEIHSREINNSGGYNYSMLRELYQGIVSYKDIKSRQLLEKTINESDGSTKEYHSEFIWLALKKYPNEIYNGIIDKLNYTKDEIAGLESEWSWQLE
ncbi:hypothetical protein [Psychroserpens algicola]|uniref:hypothetical protein n=1 Tax=Psychroserpens algicola TaxID=1719034 RepID=UPI0019546DDB|nr:hypothetical protein [Psychroserpens algicola]